MTNERLLRALTGTQVHAAVNECTDLHGMGPDFPRTWVDSNIDFNELAEALNKRLVGAEPQAVPGPAELMVSWPEYWSLAQKCAADLEDAGVVESGLDGIKAMEIIQRRIATTPSTEQPAIQARIARMSHMMVHGIDWVPAHEVEIAWGAALAPSAPGEKK